MCRESGCIDLIMSFILELEDLKAQKISPIGGVGLSG